MSEFSTFFHFYSRQICVAAISKTPSHPSSPSQAPLRPRPVSICRLIEGRDGSDHPHLTIHPFIYNCSTHPSIYLSTVHLCFIIYSFSKPILEMAPSKLLSFQTTNCTFCSLHHPSIKLSRRCNVNMFQKLPPYSTQL